jgi:hypothetical protein
MKNSIVKFIHKKRNKMNPANYRPIPLLTAFSKVLEKALYIRLTEHLSTYQLLADNQFGFRTGTATEDAILKLTNGILNPLNNKITAGRIFCHLEKALDSVHHDIPVSKLQYYGIRGKAILLLESYLQNRHQRVYITNTHFNSNSV